MMFGREDRPCSTYEGRASYLMKVPSCAKMMVRIQVENISNDAGSRCFMSFL